MTTYEMKSVVQTRMPDLYKSCHTQQFYLEEQIGHPHMKLHEEELIQSPCHYPELLFMIM